MKLRVSISGLMVAVAWVALDFAAYRALTRVPIRYQTLLAFCLWPMANVLFGVLVLVGSGRRRGVVRPFAVGFAAAGGTALVLYASLIAANPDRVGHAVDDSLRFLEPLARSRTPLGVVAAAFLSLLAVQMPALLPALIGGWWYRRRRRPTEPGAGGPRPHGIGRPEAEGTRLAGFARRD